jgi:putative glutamine amidotransferase
LKPVIAVTLSSQELPHLVHWRRMFEGLQECGAIPLAIDCGGAPIRISGLVARVDGLILGGGVDVDPIRYGGNRRDPLVQHVDPIRDSNEIAAFESAWQRRIPTLAICRGAHVVNAARGGTLYADLTRDRPSHVTHRRSEEELIKELHSVNVADGSRLASWIDRDGEMPVNSQHHQGIRELAPGFNVVARADDGLIEAYEAHDQPLTAVQWHPEINWASSETSRSLMCGFVASCRDGAATPIDGSGLALSRG